MMIQITAYNDKCTTSIETLYVIQDLFGCLSFEIDTGKERAMITLNAEQSERLRNELKLLQEGEK